VGRALSALETEIGEEGDIELFAADQKRPKEERLTEEAPIIKMVAVILRHAVEGNASDIHIEPEENSVVFVSEWTEPFILLFSCLFILTLQLLPGLKYFPT